MEESFNSDETTGYSFRGKIKPLLSNIQKKVPDGLKF